MHHRRIARIGALRAIRYGMGVDGLRVISFHAIHYGMPYLDASIRSVVDAVDQVCVIYTPVGSHGTRSTIPCPDSRDELLRVASKAAGRKLFWREGVFHSEGHHRGAIFHYQPDADLILVCDSDEVFMPSQIDILLSTAAKGTVRNYLAYEMPFWRSFKRAIPDKLCQPVRVINTRFEGGTQGTDAFFAHFGYCQPTKYIEFKKEIHGHRADWRPEWFTDKWLVNAQEDVHPTNHNFWNVQGVNPLDYMPSFMTEHPFFNLDLIP